ncbi:MAG: sigma 54-interacting transcriptional regulator, partial [bacterium]|nr:sigma 54-interacting transcriptional regulator [bacterium]
DRLTIGSSSERDIYLTDSVLPYHARLERVSKGILLIQQEGPVLINGQPLIGSQLLVDGDFFDIGAYRFQLLAPSLKTLTASLQQKGPVLEATLPTLHFISPLKKSFKRARILIGRTRSADLLLSDPFTSEKHAEIFSKGGLFYLRDLHSRNGTYINDYKISERELPPNGTLRFGRLSFSYHIETPVKELPEQIPGYSFSSKNSSCPSQMIVGNSLPFNKTIAKLKTIAPSNDTVLLLGETGTGKELLAQLLHAENPDRNQGPFVVVNCATIPQTVADSQLFGHTKGSFTGAIGDHKGYFQQAHQGTLFLDEIGELPLESQARLLRVLEDKKIRPVGATKETPINIRIVLATNRDVEAHRFDGKFREDLYQRFDWIIQVPPLRERKEDLVWLVKYFLRENAPIPLSISPQVFAELQTYPWPGNIRELQRATRRAITNVIARRETSLLFSDFELQGKTSPLPAKASHLRQQKREMLPQLLKDFQGNISQVARELGVSRLTLRRWIEKEGIDLTTLKE